jgi:hypothetical protein
MIEEEIDFVQELPTFAQRFIWLGDKIPRPMMLH